MNPVLLVIPILALLMFTLGLTLRADDFRLLRERPLPVLIGMIGQLVCLPVLAWMIGRISHLPPLFFLGLMLIACSPGGSSSNIFSMLARGDVALSVSLTALSSILTIVTIPLVMGLSMRMTLGTAEQIQLPVWRMLAQNLLLTLFPILAGVVVKRFWTSLAARLQAVLSRLAFPALALLAILFFIRHRILIFENMGQLGLSVTALLLVSMTCGAGLSFLFHFTSKVRRTLVIEIGMQNAAQAIALASSPFVFNQSEMAIPAILYALMMNVVLLVYVAVVSKLDSHFVS